MQKSRMRMMFNSDTFGIVFIVAVMLFIMIVLRPNYLSRGNIISLARTLAITAVIGFSQTALLSVGGMNVAIGAIGGLCAVLSGVMMGWLGMMVGTAIVISILIGGFCGFLNGFLTLKLGGVGVASFLATLATSFVFSGITLTITRGKPIYNIPREFFSLGSASPLFFPNSIYFMLFLAAVLWFMYKYTGLGKQLLAFGGNEKAAQLYGVRIGRVVIISHLISGLLAAFAGLLTVMRIEAAQTNIGTDWMLMSMAAPLLGGTRLSGGKVNIAGVIFGAVVLVIIANALVHLKVDVYWTSLVNGLVILLVAGLDVVRVNRRKKLGLI
ncbi:MAG: ABC transporter permease [Treponema sp.]|nr:ABC transporter permease [Treponema sp.]